MEEIEQGARRGDTARNEDANRLMFHLSQYGGSPIKVGDEEYSIFRDHE